MKTEDWVRSAAEEAGRRVAAVAEEEGMSQEYGMDPVILVPLVMQLLPSLIACFGIDSSKSAAEVQQDFKKQYAKSWNSAYANRQVALAVRRADRRISRASARIIAANMLDAMAETPANDVVGSLAADVNAMNTVVGSTAVDHSRNRMARAEVTPATKTVCKMRCDASTQFGGLGTRFTFNAACNDGTPEHDRFHKYTPSGSLEIHVDNPAAEAMFAVGQHYYMVIEPAES